MKNSDFIVALYYLNNPVHKYASPNKFYESLFLSIPIITTRNTLVGDRVDASSTGYTIGDAADDLKLLLSEWGKDDFMNEYKQRTKNCRALWESSYCDYEKSILQGGSI